MKPEDQSKRQAAPACRTYKTKEDFLRWLREKDPGKKQAQPEEIPQADSATSQALMVWADDGGATA
jgi:hypothetical protein